MVRRRSPETAAGYYVLHDFRRIDWTAWAETSPVDREELLEEAVTFLETEADREGGLACYSILGHKADLLVLVLRPHLADLDAFERQFQQLALASLMECSTSAVGVTEASGYTEAAADFFDPDAEADPGLERYMRSRLYPELPDAEFVSFYFMNKRRGPEYNWYALPYEERADHIARHGEIGKEYAGRVTQLITGTTGFDDWEWGITLFASDMVAIKDLLTEMRFDSSTSRFAEFGRFFVGRRFPITELQSFLSGEPIPVEERAGSPEDAGLEDELSELGVRIDAPEDAHVVIVDSEAEPEELGEAVGGLRGNFEHYDSHIHTTVETAGDRQAVVSVWATAQAAETAAGFLEELPGGTDARAGALARDVASTTSTDDETAGEVRSALEAAGVYAGQPHGEDVHAVVLYSTADVSTLTDEVAEVTDAFDRHDSHEATHLYASTDGDRTAIVSLWDREEAAERAAGHLGELPGIERPEKEIAGFTTMGMFYRVVPEHRDAFVETFAEVGDVLAAMDGHLETDLLVNVDDEDDMFIASRWRAREDAMAFFRSDAFRETVQFGREILADRPRHVFLV